MADDAGAPSQRGKWYNLRTVGHEGNIIAVFLLNLAPSALAGARAVVPSLPEAVTPDAEVSTNIVPNVDAARPIEAE